MIGYLQLFTEPYVMTARRSAARDDEPRALHVRGGVPLVAARRRGGHRLHAVRPSSSRFTVVQRRLSPRGGRMSASRERGRPAAVASLLHVRARRVRRTVARCRCSGW